MYEQKLIQQSKDIPGSNKKHFLHIQIGHIENL